MSCFSSSRPPFANPRIAEKVSESDLISAMAAAPNALDRQFTLASHLITKGRTEVLSEIWRASPARFPHDPRWRLLSALAWFWTGADRARALAEARAARTIDPNFWPAHLAEAHLACEVGEYDMITQGFRDYWSHGRRRFTNATRHALMPAVEAVHRALALTNEATVWNDLGAIEFASGRFEAAAAAFRRAIEIEPTQRHALVNLAVTLLVMDDGDALETYTRQTVFPVSPPPCLGATLAGIDGERAAWWRQPAIDTEWRRITVFSQRWWRILPDTMAPPTDTDRAGGCHPCA